MRSLTEIDDALRDIEQRVAQLEEPPRVIRDGSGFKFAGDWSEDADSPLRFYLRSDGFVYFSGRLSTPNDSGQTTILTLPDQFRPLGFIRLLSAFPFSTFTEPEWMYINIDTDGTVSCRSDVAGFNAAAFYLNGTYYTKYPIGD